MDDSAEHVTSEQCFFLEFATTGIQKLMHLRFWKEDQLCRIFVGRSGLASAGITGELRSVARLLSVVSPKADIIACR